MSNVNPNNLNSVEDAKDWLDEDQLLLSGVIVVSIGANLGSEKEIGSRFSSVIAALSKEWGGSRVSRYYRTTPVGAVLDQPDFINGVIAWKPSFPISAVEVLLTLHEQEEKHGRVRSIAGGSRTLDLDLLLVGEQKCSLAKLELPHPRMQERAFVLAPLKDLFGSQFNWVGQSSSLDSMLRQESVSGQGCVAIL